MQYRGVESLPADDADLLRRARRGDESAFQDIYQRHRLPVFRYAWRLTGSIPIAEDVLQECFLALFRGAAFDPRQGSLRTYLFGMARRLAMRRARLDERETGRRRIPLRRTILWASCCSGSGRQLWSKPLRGFHRCKEKRSCCSSMRTCPWRRLPESRGQNWER
jgi:hypothetical protein